MLTRIFLQGLGATALIGAAALAWSGFATPVEAADPTITPAPLLQSGTPPATTTAATAAPGTNGYLASPAYTSRDDRRGGDGDKHHGRDRRHDDDDDDDDRWGTSWAPAPLPSRQEGGR